MKATFPTRWLAVLVMGALAAGAARLAASPDATTTALTVPAAATLGQAVTLTAAVTPTGATGAVTFYDGVAILGSATVSSGTATLTTALLSPGAHAILARYDGDETDAPSASQKQGITVSATDAYGFLAPTTYGGGAGAGIAITDFNGDGYPDVAALAPAGLSDPGELQVLLGGSAVPLTLSTTIQVVNPGALAAGDIDGDGRTDLVFTDGSKVAVLFGNGDGTFQATPVSFTLNAQPTALAVIDLNRDGRADIAATAQDNTLTVALGGSDQMQVLSPITAPTAPRAIGAADFNADGNADLVVGADDGTVAVFRGNGDGTFAAPVTSTTVANAGISALAVADFSGDGLADVAAANARAGSITVLTADGAGGLRSTGTYAVRSPVSIAATDVNGDGAIDLVSASGALSGIDILFAEPGGFMAPAHEASGITPNLVAATELNGDGRADLVLGSTAGNPLSVLFGSVFGLTATPNPSTHGEPVTLTAMAPPDASGTVSFSDGGTALGSAPLSSGTAVLTTTALPPGGRTIQAAYSGDATHAAASSNVDVDVRHVVVEVDLAASKNPSDAFDPVSFTATVTGEVDSNETPTGTVTFTDTNPSGTETATVPLADGGARWDRPRLYPGAHTITARYNGDSSFAALTSQALTQTVTGHVQCIFGVSPNPALSGQTVTVTSTCVDSGLVESIYSDGWELLSGQWTELGDGFRQQLYASSTFPIGNHSLSATPGPSAPYSFAIQPPVTSAVVRVVTSFADSGPGTLRQEIADANAGDTITFASSSFIALNTPIEITKPLTIMGPSEIDPLRSVVLDGEGKTRLLVIRSGGVAIRRMAFTNGFNAGGNGGSGFAGGGGGAGMGGAVFVTAPGGTVVFDHDWFSSNSVVGGAGGSSLMLSGDSADAYGSGGGGGMDGHAAGTGTSTNVGAGGAGGVVDGSGGQGAWGRNLGTPGAFGGGAGGGFYQTDISRAVPVGFGGGGAGSLSPVGVDESTAGETGGSGGVARITEQCAVILNGTHSVCGSTTYIGGAGGGGGGLGGAIFVKDGHIEVANSSFSQNRAIGGVPGETPPPNDDNWVDSFGTAAQAGPGSGGAIYSGPGGSVGLEGGNTFIGSSAGSDDVNGHSITSGATGLHLLSPRILTAPAGGRFTDRITVQATFGGGFPIADEPVTFQISGAHFADGTWSSAATTDANGMATSPPLVAGLVPGQYVGRVASDAYGSTDFLLDVSAAGITTVSLQAPGGDQSTYGDGSSLVATVTRTPAGTATGSVEFLDGTHVLGSAPLVGSTATLPIRQLPPGYYLLTAIYTGDTTTVGSTSDAFWHVVTALPSQTFTAASNASLGAQHFVLGSFTKHSEQAAAIVNGGISVADLPLGQTTQTYPTAQTASAVAAGDFNGDGYTDVLVTLPGSVAVYLGGTNGLTAGGTITVPQGASVVTADFNDDGHLDVAVVQPSTTVQTWFGQGDGRFAAGPASTIAFGTNTFGVAATGDFDLDGRADLAILDTSGTHLIVLGGDGAGNFSAVTQTSSAIRADGLTVGDFDGSGWPDVALVRDDGSAAVSFGPFDPNSGPAYTGSTPATNAVGTSIVSADLDGDGFEDLITADGHLARVYYSRGDGTFGNPLTLPNVGPIQVAVGELTGDSRADLAVLTTDGAMRVMAGGPGSPSVTWHQPNAIAPGTPLGIDQLNATANEAGAFVYTPAAGTVLPAGLQTLSLTFIPRDPAQPHVSTTTQIWVRTPIVIWVPAPLVWPQTAGPGPAQFNASTDAAGTFTYSWVDDLNNPPPYETGNPFTLHAHFVPTNLLDWPVTEITRSIQLLRADPVVTWNPAPIPFGMPIGAAQLNATATGVDGADLPGTLLYEPISGTVPAHSGPFPVQLMFQPNDAPDYNPLNITKNVDVQFVPTTITSQPASLVACTGETAHFSVGATATSLVYRWRINGQPIVDSGAFAGTSTQALSIAVEAAGLNLSDSYQVDVLVNETLSQPATLTFQEIPALRIDGVYNPPVGQHLILTSTDVSQGLHTAGLQWQYSTDQLTWTDLPGQTAATLDIPSASVANNGYYRIVGSNTCGTRPSSAFFVSVTKLSQQITGVALPGTVHYGDTLSFVGEASSGLPLIYQAAGGPISVVDGQLHATGIGPFKVLVTQPGNDTYDAAPQYLYTGTIQPAPLVAHLQSTSRTYGAPNPAPTFTYTGLVNGDTPGAIGVDPTNLPTITSPAVTADAGTYSIGISGNLIDRNYDIEIDASSAQMEIDPAPLTIHVNDLTKVYGDPTPAFSFYYVGLVLGQTQPPYGGPPQFTFEQPTPLGTDVYLPAGTYTVTATQIDSDYTVTADPGTLTVLKAPLSVTADNQTRYYGTANPVFTATAVGLKNSESVGGIGLSLTTTATDQSPVGTYAITLGEAPPNYAVTFTPGTLTITPWQVAVTMSTTTKVYGAPLPPFANVVQITGARSDAEAAAVRAALTFTTSATQSSDVGNYVVTPEVSSTNYSIVVNRAGTLTVTPAPLRVTGVDATRMYGAPNPAFQVSYSGFVLNQEANVLAGALTFTAPDVNTGVGQYSFTPGGLTSANYTIAFVPGTLTITKAPLTITAKDVTRHYGYPASYPVEYTGLVASDTPTNAGAVVTTAATDASLPGTYTLTPTGGPTANYSIDYVNGTLTIDKAPLTITASSYTGSYGDPFPVTTASYSGFVLGQGPSVLQGPFGFGIDPAPTVARPDANTYTVTPQGVSSSTYDIAFAPGTVVIKKIPLAITGPAVTRTYGQPNPTFGADMLTYNGFVAGDGPSDLIGTWQFSTEATERSSVGQYGVTLSGDVSATNYDLVLKPGLLTVAPAPLTIRTNDAAMTYGGAPPVFTASYSGFVLGETAAVLSGTLQFTPSASTPFAGGTHVITPSGLTAVNYAIQYVPGTLTVNAAPLTVTVVDARKTYGQPNPVFSVTYSGFQGNDDPSALAGSLTFSTTAVDGSAAGTYAITAGGLTSSNYAVQFNQGTLTITPAPLTVTALVPHGRQYGDPNPTFSVSYSGFVLNDGPQILGGTLSFAAPDATTAPGTYDVTPGGLMSNNYAITYVPDTMQIVAAPLIVTVDAATKLYGQPNPAFTVSYQGFKNGEGPSVLSNAPVFQTTATDTSLPGSYVVNVSGLAAINYRLVFEPGELTIQKGRLVVSASPISRIYGSDNPATVTPVYTGLVPGSESQITGQLVYTTPATAASPVGSYPVTLSGLSSAYYDITYAPATLTVTPAPLTVQAVNTTRAYGTPNFTPYPVTYSGFRNGDSASALAGSLTFTTSADPTSAVGTYPITPGGLTSQDYVIAFRAGTITVTPATPTFTFAAAPPSLKYPAPLTADQMTARANVPGTFTYDPAIGAVLAPGCYTVTASFTPTDSVDYTGGSTTFLVCINLGVQHITWTPPASLTYPQALDASRLNATVIGDGGQATGALTYTPPPGTILDAGSQTLRVSAAATSYYAAAAATVTVNVLPGTQTIAWSANPAPLRYDQRLSSAQMTAIATGSGPARPGTISYSPSPYMNSVGLQTLTAMAAATQDYNQATATIQVMVSPAPLVCSGLDSPYGEQMIGQPVVTPMSCSTPSGQREPDFSVGETEPASLPAGTYLPQLVFNDPNGHAVNYSITTPDWYYIDNPGVSIESLDHTSAVAGSGPLAIDIHGSGFVPSCAGHCPPVQCPTCYVDTVGTSVQWNGQSLPVTYVSPTDLTVTIPAELLATSGVANLTVSNYNVSGPSQAGAPFFITDQATTVEASGSSTSWDPTVSLPTGTTGDQPGVSASTDEGAGSVTAAIYTSNPARGFAAGSAYFDVFAQPDQTSPFTQLTIVSCLANPEPTDRIFWYDGSTWQPASNQTFTAGPPACIQVIVNDQTTPSLSQLTGTYFAVVKDSVPPTITMPSGGVVAEATSAQGAAVSYTVTAVDNMDPSPSLSCAPASGALFPLGSTTVTCTASDQSGNVSTGSFAITVHDTTAPVIASVTPSVRSIWPPDHRMVSVTLDVVATDAVTATPTCQIASVSSSESGHRPGGDDWQITGPLTLNVEASRDGSHDGRSYLIGVTCSDQAGNTSPMTTTAVVVPHDLGRDGNKPSPPKPTGHRDSPSPDHEPARPGRNRGGVQ